MFAQEHESENVQEDAIDFNVPASEDTVIARPGDIWLLGNHRLMCGDCRSKSDITALMDGQHADLCVTDPPYNVNYEGGTEEELTIQNDSMEKRLVRHLSQAGVLCHVRRTQAGRILLYIPCGQ